MNTPSSSNVVKGNTNPVRMVPLPDLSKLPVLKPGSKLHNIKTSSHDKATNSSSSTNQHEPVSNSDRSSSISNLNPRTNANQPVDVSVNTFAMLNEKDNDVSLNRQSSDDPKSHNQSPSPQNQSSSVNSVTTSVATSSKTVTNSNPNTNTNNPSKTSSSNVNANDKATTSPVKTPSHTTQTTSNSTSTVSHHLANASLDLNPDLIAPIMAFDKAFADLEQVQNSFIYNVTKTEDDDFLTRYNQGHLDLPVFDQDASDNEETSIPASNSNANSASASASSSAVNPTEAHNTVNPTTAHVHASNIVHVGTAQSVPVAPAQQSVHSNLDNNPSTIAVNHYNIPPLAYQSANDLADDYTDTEPDVAINDLADFDQPLIITNQYQQVSPVQASAVITNSDEPVLSSEVSDNSVAPIVTNNSPSMSISPESPTSNATTAAQYEVMVDTTNSEPVTEPTVTTEPVNEEQVTPIAVTSDEQVAADLAVVAETAAVDSQSVAVLTPSVFASSIDHKEESYDYSHNRVASVFGILAFIGVVGLVVYLGYVLFNLIW